MMEDKLTTKEAQIRVSGISFEILEVSVQFEVITGQRAESLVQNKQSWSLSWSLSALRDRWAFRPRERLQFSKANRM